MSSAHPANQKKLLMAKALGFTTAISKLSREERNQNPSGTFGHDYNSLRQAVLDGFPGVASILPPEANISEAMYGGTFTAEKYGEIYTFCEHIFQILAALESEIA